MPEITVMFFATLRDHAGGRSVSLSLPEGSRVADLKAHLSEEYPALAPSLGYVLTSVNKVYAQDEDAIPEGAEVALFPPVSGGSGEEFPDVYAVTEEEIDLNDLVARITRPGTGAAGIFTGMVRGVTTRGDGRETAFLEYEAYVPMAEAKMAQVAQEIRDRWPAVQGIAIVQRIGKLYPGTPTVLIACTAAHRDTGVFEAARYGIDRLKQIVPIWKKEVGPDGESWIEGDYIPHPGE